MADTADLPVRRRREQGLVRTFRRAPLVPAAIMMVMATMAAGAGVLAPHSPVAIRMDLALKPPSFVEGGEPGYFLGTDPLGRDILSRLMHGARASLLVAGLSIGFATVVGTGLGLLAGYSGGPADTLIMRAVDVVLTFPVILLALIFVVTIGPSVWVVTAILALVLWSRFARLVRGEVLSWKEREFVTYARATGASPLRIVVVHLLPNITNSIVVLATLQVGFAIVVEASLSFLGAGIPPPAPSWGGMIASGRAYLETAWWLVAFPALAVALTVLSFNLFGDWLRDTLDPTLRQL
jgi:peptide/nickel transport system permease protein